MNAFLNPRRLIAGLCLLSLAVAGTSTAVAQGLMQSAAKVDAIATYVDAAGGDAGQAIQVRLDIADGWHVNAHPASLDFLVATSINATVDGEPVPLTVAWPEGHDSGIELGGTEIKVYRDGIVLPVQLDTAAAGAQPTLNIRVQSCSDEGLCLPPSTLSVQPEQS